MKLPTNRWKYLLLCLVLLCCGGCKPDSTAKTAFYYWKTAFSLSRQQAELLRQAAGNRLYLRFFDVTWNQARQMAVPVAVTDIRQDVRGLQICPVVYLTNKTFEHTPVAGADSLAARVSRLVSSIAAQHQISYNRVQVDCDWTVGTRSSYFAFLKAFKKYSAAQLEVTIRLHQIKYPDLTGIPPADRGLLMYYNMGKVSASPGTGNSIYNAADAAKYIGTLSRYPLPLDLALPVYSWSLQIRNGKVIQLYGQISRNTLSNQSDFQPAGRKDLYRAAKSFYLDGVYIRKGDLFKLEEMTMENLQQAARQVAVKLKPLKDRNIIYYELSNLNFSLFPAAGFKAVSARF